MYTLRAVVCLLILLAGILMIGQSSSRVLSPVAGENTTISSLADEEYIQKYLTYPGAVPMKKFNTEHAMKTSASPEEVNEWYKKQFKKIGYPQVLANPTDPESDTLYFVGGKNKADSVSVYIGKLTYEDSTFIEFHVYIKK